MSKEAHAVVNGIDTHFRRYTRRELQQAWYNSNGQGNLRARDGGRHCLTIPCSDEEEALDLTSLFVRKVFAIPSCVHWDGDRITFYCGDAGSGWRGCLVACERMVERFQLNRGGYIQRIEKESGLLFAEELSA